MAATRTNSSDDLAGAYPNAQRLLWAGFMAILAAGVGFAIRGGILDNWREQFGFTASQVGQITGAGLTGFCFGIIIGGVIVDGGRFDVQVNGRPVPMTVHLGAFYDPAGEKVKS